MKENGTADNRYVELPGTGISRMYWIYAGTYWYRVMPTAQYKLQGQQKHDLVVQLLGHQADATSKSKLATSLHN
jgi:hypothetical protein